MRRADRQVTDPDEIRRILDRCTECRIALNAPDGYPYIVPLNFGYSWEPDAPYPTLYFHSATEGTKLTLIDADPRASVEMDCDHQLLSVAQRGYCTMNYRSIIGRGLIEYITDPEQKLRALTLLTDRYHPEGHFPFSTAAMERTIVYKLTLSSLTAKSKQTHP